MTKIPVNIPEFVPNMSMGAGKVQDTEGKGDFGKILEKQKSTETNGTEKKPKEDVTESYDDNTPQVRDTEENHEADTNNVSKDSEVKEVTSTDSGKNAGQEDEQEFTTEAMQMILPMLNVAVSDVKELLATELGISMDELNALMDGMQITEEQLLDFEVVKDLFMQAKGAEDVTALLTDENLLNSMQNLEAEFAQVMENVQETLGIAEEDMEAVKNQLGQMKQSQEPVITIETEVQVQSVKESSDAGREEAPADNRQTFQWTGQNPMNTTENVAGSGNVTQPQGSYSTMQAMDIMNQVMDYMRIQLNEETSSLEMQLQPESLGTLQIRISAKEGLMTAQFTTASDSVKAVLESQMVQLQQQLESQNIKVDAIEVMVETHAFESALQQGEERQQADGEKKERTRRIDLNSLRDDEEMTDEERIVAEMMAANGNTVDYLA